MLDNILFGKFPWLSTLNSQSTLKPSVERMACHTEAERGRQRMVWPSFCVRHVAIWIKQANHFHFLASPVMVETATSNAKVLVICL